MGVREISSFKLFWHRKFVKDKLDQRSELIFFNAKCSCEEILTNYCSVRKHLDLSDIKINYVQESSPNRFR